jgi:hypothetical protein
LASLSRVFGVKIAFIKVIAFFQNIKQTSAVNFYHEMSAAALLLIFLFKEA